MAEQGKVLEVNEVFTGDSLVSDHASGVTVLLVYDASDFSEAGGDLEINGVIYPYTGLDLELNTITLSTPLSTPEAEDTEVYLYPRSKEKVAMVELTNLEEAVSARVPHSQYDKLADGVRSEADQESVLVELEGSDYVIVDVIGKIPQMDGAYIQPGTIPENTIVIEPPTVTPSLTVIPGIGSFHLRWPSEANPSSYVVQVHVNTVDFVPVLDDPLTLVTEVSGTSATVHQLADGTNMEPGVTYYFAILATNTEGSATPSATISGQLRQVDTPDISVNAAWVGTMTVDRLLGGEASFDAIFAGGSIEAHGVGGEVVGLSGEGFYVYGPTALGNPTYVQFPVDGRPNIIGGTLIANTLSVEGDSNTGQAATFRLNSQFEPDSTLTLNDSIIAPVAAPTMASVAHDVLATGVTFESTPIQGAFWNDTDQAWYTLHRVSNRSGYTNVVIKVTEPSEGTYVIEELGIIDWDANPSYPITIYTAFTGIVKAGANYYFLGENPDTHDLVIRRYTHDGDLFFFEQNVTIGSSGNYGRNAFGFDGTDFWVAYQDGTNKAIRFKRFLGTLASGTVQQTVTTTKVLGTTTHDLYSLNIGAYDFGSSKFLLTYRSNSTYNMSVFTSAGAADAGNEFNLMRSGASYLTWQGLSTDSTKRFVGFTMSGDEFLYVQRYTKLKLTNRTNSWWFSTTYYRSSDGDETTSSPHVVLTMNSRWKWKLTIATPPSGVGARIYAGTSSGTTNAKRQDPALATGVLSTTRDVIDFVTGPAPPTLSTFDSITPASLRSQATAFRPLGSTTTTSGSPTLTGTGFTLFDEDLELSGTGIPAGTKVLSVQSSTSLTMTNNATSSSTSSDRQIKSPKLEIRGDGYARITELESVILTSTQDVTNQAGNRPALRIGNIAGSHLRLDGNEIISMSDDDTQGMLLLNPGGGVSFAGKQVSNWHFGKVSITTNASGQDTIAHSLGTTPTIVLGLTEGTSIWEALFSNYTSSNVTVTLRSRVDNSVAGSGVSPNIAFIALAT